MKSSKEHNPTIKRDGCKLTFYQKVCTHHLVRIPPTKTKQNKKISQPNLRLSCQIVNSNPKQVSKNKLPSARGTNLLMGDHNSYTKGSSTTLRVSTATIRNSGNRQQPSTPEFLPRDHTTDCNKTNKTRRRIPHDLPISDQRRQE